MTSRSDTGMGKFLNKWFLSCPSMIETEVPGIGIAFSRVLENTELLDLDEFFNSLPIGAAWACVFEGKIDGGLPVACFFNPGRGTLITIRYAAEQCRDKPDILFLLQSSGDTLGFTIEAIKMFTYEISLDRYDVNKKAVFAAALLGYKEDHGITWTPPTGEVYRKLKNLFDMFGKYDDQ